MHHQFGGQPDGGVGDTPLVLSVMANPGGGMVLNLTGPPEATGILEMTTNLGLFNGWQFLNTNVLTSMARRNS